MVVVVVVVVLLNQCSMFLVHFCYQVAIFEIILFVF